jgi:hypothetical protein
LHERGGAHRGFPAAAVNQRGAQALEQVMPRDLELQVRELKIQASILNRFTRLGTPETVSVAQRSAVSL